MLPAEEDFDGGSAAAFFLVRALSSGYGAEKGTQHRSDSSMSTGALLTGIILIGLAFCCCFFM